MFLSADPPLLGAGSGVISTADAPTSVVLCVVRPCVAEASCCGDVPGAGLDKSVADMPPNGVSCGFGPAVSSAAQKQ